MRNFGDGFGLPWQTVFQTESPEVVERECLRKGIKAEWKDEERLRVSTVLPAVVKHPQSGELSWFNHATFFHVTTLEPVLREVLLEEFAEEDLPTNTYYGDGSRIEPAVLEELRTLPSGNDLLPMAGRRRNVARQHSHSARAWTILRAPKDPGDNG